MKFYKAKNKLLYSILKQIAFNKQNAVVCGEYSVIFFNNGIEHNLKNAAYVNFMYNFKEYRVDGFLIGTNATLNKRKFRSFVATRMFL